MARKASKPVLAKSFHDGFSLIEVLVTLIVLSIGLLSLAVLQITTLKNNNSALTRFEATILAYDILDRMRANRGLAIRGEYNIAMNLITPAGADIASNDMHAWTTALSAHLPSGSGSIIVNDRQATVTITWLENWDETLGHAPENRFMKMVFRTEL